jgi:hypothetical protein
MFSAKMVTAWALVENRPHAIANSADALAE